MPHSVLSKIFLNLATHALYRLMPLKLNLRRFKALSPRSGVLYHPAKNIGAYFKFMGVSFISTSGNI